MFSVKLMLQSFSKYLDSLLSFRYLGFKVHGDRTGGFQGNASSGTHSGAGSSGDYGGSGDWGGHGEAGSVGGHDGSGEIRAAMVEQGAWAGMMGQGRFGQPWWSRELGPP